MTSVLAGLDVGRVSERARREARNREVHLPPVSAYRWWARRTVAVNDAVLEAVEREGERARVRVAPLVVLDPFAGGGVIPLVALARGHVVHAQEIEPWAAHGLDVTLRLPSPRALLDAGERLRRAFEPLATHAYETRFVDGSKAAMAHTLRVATASCPSCRRELRLFPHALVTLARRKERGGDEAFLACRRGHLFRGAAGAPCRCPACDDVVDPRASYLPRRRASCAECGATTPLARLALSFVPALVERAGGGRRELGVATDEERARAGEHMWLPARDLGAIPDDGVETAVLRRHGFRRWHELFPRRQRATVEWLLAAVDGLERVSDDARAALRLAVVGACEMAGHLSRWDRFYLKAYEAMAGHRFNVTTLPVEPHPWGCGEAGRGTVARRVAQLVKAARWLEEHVPDRARARVCCGSSARLALDDESVDLALTDPPYHDDVQYAELSAPLRAWAGLDDARERPAVARRGDRSWRDRVREVLVEVRRVLRPDGRLIFSYANRNPDAWLELLGALDEAGFFGRGFTVVHSENERDASKRGVRACQLDLLLDVAPAPVSDRALPAKILGTLEEDFLHVVGRYVLEVGRLEAGWERALSSELRAHPFLARGH